MKIRIPSFFTLILLVLALSLNAQNGIKLGHGNFPGGQQLPNQNLQLARQYYEKGEYEKALTYLDKIPRNQSMNEVYELSLNCYLALKQYKDAEKLAEDYIKNIRGNNARYYADLEYIYLEEDKQNKAEKLVDDVMDQLQRNPGLAYSFASAFDERGYPKIALQIYENAEKLLPNANFQYQKALLYGEMGNVKKMYESYVNMVGTSPHYLNTVEQLLARAFHEETGTENIDYLKTLLIEKIQKEGSQSYNDLLIFIFIQEKNFRGAFTQLKALDKRNPGNKAEIFNLGKVAANNEDYDLAHQIFQYVIDAGSQYAFYESAVAASLDAERQRLLGQSDSIDPKAWHELQNDYFKGLKKLNGQPEAADVTIQLADLTAFQLNEVDTAIGMLKNLLNHGFAGPEDVARAKIKLGDILLYKGNRWDAIIYYGQAEKAFEQSPIGQEAKFKRAKAAYYVGDFKWAQGIFDALKMSTSKLIANDAMSYSLLITENTALDTNTDAMKMYAKADLLNYQNKPDSALHILNQMEIAFIGNSIQDEALFLKSKILTKQHKYQEAADALEELISKYNNDILADDALYALAQLYDLHLANKTKAKDLYEKLFIEHPDSFFASDARKCFREMRGDIVN